MVDQKKKNESLELEEAISKSEAFVLKYKKPLIGGIAAIILIIAGILCYKNYYSNPREEKASAAMAKAEEHFRNNDFEIALKGDSLGTPGFLKIISDNSGTDAANIAKVYAGECYAQLGQYKEAIDMLSGFDEGDQMISPAVLGTLGNCYTQLGQIDKAVSTLLNAAKKAGAIINGERGFFGFLKKKVDQNKAMPQGQATPNNPQHLNDDLEERREQPPRGRRKRKGTLEYTEGGPESEVIYSGSSREPSDD